MQSKSPERFIKPLQLLCPLPLALMVIFGFGAVSKLIPISVGSMIFWLSHLVTVVCIFLIVPIAKSHGKSGFLWAVGTLLFAPMGTLIAGLRLVYMTNEVEKH